MGMAYLPFVLAMDAPIRNRIMLTGTIYVSGALGMEAVGGYFHARGGFSDPYYIVAFLIEETLEIVGLTLLATTLLRMISDCFPGSAKAGATTGNRPLHAGIPQPS